MSSSGDERAVLLAALETTLRESSGLAVLFSQAVADSVGLNPTDLETLDVLVRHGAMTAGRLAEMTGLTTGAVTGLIDRLERRGYARRERHPADRRSVIVQPDFAAIDRDLEPAYAGMKTATADLFCRYSDHDLRIVLDFMRHATAMTTEEITRLRTNPARRA
ncbi:MAG: MarR family transcriptional regulator [Thermomicrobiales bacterium]